MIKPIEKEKLQEYEPNNNECRSDFFAVLRLWRETEAVGEVLEEVDGTKELMRWNTSSKLLQQMFREEIHQVAY